jgi:hypothetical protein
MGCTLQIETYLPEQMTATVAKPQGGRREAKLK